MGLRYLLACPARALTVGQLVWAAAYYHYLALDTPTVQELMSNLSVIQFHFSLAGQTEIGIGDKNRAANFCVLELLNKVSFRTFHIRNIGVCAVSLPPPFDWLCSATLQFRGIGVITDMAGCVIFR